ncbi:hypothetical protein Hdeb2414_s0007g00230181 [Helianthus debilis subsp. tardiflorus]
MDLYIGNTLIDMYDGFCASDKSTPGVRWFKGGSCGHNRCSICFSCWSIIKTCYEGLITYGMTSIKPILS